MTYLCSPPLFYGYILFMSAFSWLGLFAGLKAARIQPFPWLKSVIAVFLAIGGILYANSALRLNFYENQYLPWIACFIGLLLSKAALGLNGETLPASFWFIVILGGMSGPLQDSIGGTFAFVANLLLSPAILITGWLGLLWGLKIGGFKPLPWLKALGTVLLAVGLSLLIEYLTFHHDGFSLGGDLSFWTTGFIAGFIGLANIKLFFGLNWRKTLIPWLFMTLGLFAVHLALYLSSFLSIYFQYHRPF